jgi:hypothetical protein
MNNLSFCVVSADSCCVALRGKFSLGKFDMNVENMLPIYDRDNAEIIE